MSRYHPLDVRHPNNRDLERRNFLLQAPRGERRPARKAESPSADPFKATSTVGASAPPPAQTAASPARTVHAPWGSVRRAAQGAATRQAATPRTDRRKGSLGRWIILIGLGAWLLSDRGQDFLRQFPLIDGLLDGVENLLRQL